MGITRYSLATTIRPSRPKQLLSRNWSKKPSTKKQRPILDFTALQDELEDKLYSIQDRLLMTRQYIRCIRHEYEGASREAVEHYHDVINNLYSRVVNYCTRNFTENFPVFNCFLEEIEEEYMALVTEGGFSEEEAHEYVYGNDSRSVQSEPEPDPEPEPEEDTPAQLLASMRL
jgi:hypothetical protein